MYFVGNCNIIILYHIVLNKYLPDRFLMFPIIFLNNQKQIPPNLIRLEGPSMNSDICHKLCFKTSFGFKK